MILSNISSGSWILIYNEIWLECNWKLYGIITLCCITCVQGHGINHVRKWVKMSTLEICITLVALRDLINTCIHMLTIISNTNITSYIVRSIIGFDYFALIIYGFPHKSRYFKWMRSHNTFIFHIKVKLFIHKTLHL